MADKATHLDELLKIVAAAYTERLIDKRQSGDGVVYTINIPRIDSGQPSHGMRELAALAAAHNM